MKKAAFVFLGLMMATGCATTSVQSTTSASRTYETLPPPLTTYACRARYDGVDVLYLVCMANPAIAGDTGTCDMQYVAEHDVSFTNAGLLDIDCHETVSGSTDTAIFERNLKLELLEADASIAAMASDG